MKNDWLKIFYQHKLLAVLFCLAVLNFCISNFIFYLYNTVIFPSPNVTVFIGITRFAIASTALLFLIIIITAKCMLDLV